MDIDTPGTCLGITSRLFSPRPIAVINAIYIQIIPLRFLDHLCLFQPIYLETEESCFLLFPLFIFFIFFFIFLGYPLMSAILLAMELVTSKLSTTTAFRGRLGLKL